jgi:hypothetical protein
MSKLIPKDTGLSGILTLFLPLLATYSVPIMLRIISLCCKIISDNAVTKMLRIHFPISLTTYPDHILVYHTVFFGMQHLRRALVFIFIFSYRIDVRRRVMRTRMEPDYFSASPSKYLFPISHRSLKFSSYDQIILRSHGTLSGVEGVKGVKALFLCRIH